MATKGEQSGKESFGERALRKLRNLHIAIGTAALTGAVLFPQFAALSGVAAYEGVNALAHDELRKAAGSRNKRRSEHR